MGCSSCDPAAPAAPMPPPWRNLKVVTSAIAGTLLAMGFFGAMAGLPTPVATALYVAAVLIGGYFFGREALGELVSEHVIGIELLMLVATLVAGVMGQWAEAATLPRRARW